MLYLKAQKKLQFLFAANIESLKGQSSLNYDQILQTNSQKTHRVK